MENNLNKFIEEIIQEVQTELDEATTSAAAGAYSTPRAFSDDSEKDKKLKKLKVNHQVLNARYHEKEANIIVFLYNSKIPMSIHKLQSEVWGYNSKLETHTVETHIYRLRKKIFKIFNDESFLISKKNGYQIK